MIYRDGAALLWKLGSSLPYKIIEFLACIVRWLFEPIELGSIVLSYKPEKLPALKECKRPWTIIGNYADLNLRNGRSGGHNEATWRARDRVTLRRCQLLLRWRPVPNHYETKSISSNFHVHSETHDIYIRHSKVSIVGHYNGWHLVSCKEGRFL